MKLTLVIPTHNDEDALHRLLYHVSWLPELARVIVVDDGSDPALTRTPLADTLGGDRSRLTLLRHETPQGAGAARNLALDQIDTEHVMFLDADDLPTRELRDVLRDLDGQDFDFCLFQHHDTLMERDGVWGQRTFDQELWQAAGLAVGALAPVTPQAAALLCRTANYPWNKIYRTAFLQGHQIRCTEIAVHNDVELHWRSFLHAKQILTSDRIAVIHHVDPAQQRLTNRKGAERLQVFVALNRIAEEIGPHSNSPFALPFYRFAIGLIDWISGNLHPDHHPRLHALARDFYARHIPGAIRSFLQQQDQERITRVLDSNEKPAC